MLPATIPQGEKGLREGRIETNRTKISTSQSVTALALPWWLCYLVKRWPLADVAVNDQPSPPPPRYTHSDWVNTFG